MPVYRRSDGKIIEEKTKKQQSMPPVPADGKQAAGKGHLEAPTKKVNTDRSSSQELPKTKIVGLKEDADGMDDPVVGWLVVVEGPGKGRSMELGYGFNSMGRGKDNRVQLNFGDNQISRKNHATVTYDPRGKKFYVEKGSGSNLTYLNGKPVLSPVELPAQSHIRVGDTVLRFVPLGGEGFDWQDPKDNADSGPFQPIPARDQDAKDDADADSPNNSTPLHVAALRNDHTVAEILLKQGATDVNAKDNYGQTPLRIAILYKATETAEVLRQYGGKE